MRRCARRAARTCVSRCSSASRTCAAASARSHSARAAATASGGRAARTPTVRTEASRLQRPHAAEAVSRQPGGTGGRGQPDAELAPGVQWEQRARRGGAHRVWSERRRSTAACCGEEAARVEGGEGSAGLGGLSCGPRPFGPRPLLRPPPSGAAGEPLSNAREGAAGGPPLGWGAGSCSRGSTGQVRGTRQERGGGPRTRGQRFGSLVQGPEGPLLAGGGEAGARVKRGRSVPACGAARWPP